MLRKILNFRSPFHPLNIAHHLLSKKHCFLHRATYGIFIMVVGVLIAKGMGQIHYLHYPADILGYAVHGLGLTPFAEKLLEIGEDN